VVGDALAAGYRLVDTAASYGNEAAVGTAIAASGIPRDELFITTKLKNSDHGHDSTVRAFDTSLAQLRLDEIDLYLIHWPVPRRDRFIETWRAMELIHASGRARAIGVSNFTAPHLERLIAASDTIPAVNQIELHPGFPQSELCEVHATHGIVTQAWSPLGRGQGLLDHPLVKQLSVRYGRSAAQVVLRWHLDRGHAVIPKSAHPDRLRENLDVHDFTLTGADRRSLADIPGFGRLGPDPENFDDH
jgi:diketogulonate reductase-like aldo/keto reductase